MQLFLPALSDNQPKNIFSYLWRFLREKTSSLREKFYNRFDTKQRRYLFAAVIDLLLIMMIMSNGVQPAKRLMSPFVASLNSISNMPFTQTTKKTFSFAPGQAPNKFKYIDFENLSVLAYYDVPVLEDGSLNSDSWGYETIREEEAQKLIESAHYFDTKVLLTLSQVNQNHIKSILDNPSAQSVLITEALNLVKEIGMDGVVIAFEPKDGLDSNYQKKLNAFVENMAAWTHLEVENSLVAVAVPASNPSSFDLKGLSTKADKVFIIADNYATPEFKNGKIAKPVYGADEREYWNKISDSINSFTQSVPLEKLVMERAWYGNGDRYPLYTPSSKPVEDQDLEPAHVLLDSDTVNRLAARVPAKARNSARKNIPIIGKALEQEGILDSNVLAYALATIEHETDSTFEPIDEIQGRLHARRLGYEGGTHYFGRGFIQLTHLRNYRMVGERIGMGDQLAKNPELASTPEVAAKILAAFFKDNNIANLASHGNFVSARRPVNPDRNGWKVANLAFKYTYD